MATTVFTDTAKVMSKGQVTIPKDVRSVLGVEAGDRVTFLVEDGRVHMVNAATYAMQMLQQAMSGEAESVGISSEQDVIDLVSSVRSGE